MNFQKIKLYSFLLLFSGALFSCEDLETEPNQDTTNLGAAFNVDGQELVNLVNKYRTEGCTCGSEQMPAVSTITWNETLAKTAYLHSKDMNIKTIFLIQEKTVQILGIEWKDKAIAGGLMAKILQKDMQMKKMLLKVG